MTPKHVIELICRAPTLVLSECVLIYVEPALADGIIAWFAQEVPQSALAVYEQIRPGDAFGQTMLANLKACPEW
jgi:tRNA wybutosine-synthesizing protein 4